MPQCDVEGARKAGYSDDEILAHLTESRKFDIQGARNSGYSNQEIIDHLSKAPIATATAAPVQQEPEAKPYALRKFAGSFASAANPIPVDLLKSIYERGNIETIKGIAGAQGEQFSKAKEAFSKGNYLDAARYTAGWLIPLLGPAANAAGEKLAAGEYAEGLGETLGMGAQVAMPAAIAKVKSLRVAPKVKPRLNPVERAAIQFGEQEGVPLDVATRTGNQAARGV